MLSFLRRILGLGPKADFAALVKDGAVILDVRTKEEYQTGHIKGSINIPLQVLPQQLSKLKKDKPIITCCASGMRSSAAKSLLTSNGFPEVYNGGGWMSLQHDIQ